MGDQVISYVPETEISDDFREPRKVRKLVTMPAETLERVERFRAQEGIASLDATLRTLIASALDRQRQAHIAELLNGKR